MDTPRVSICLPTYQGAAYLRRLLPAIASQRTSEGVLAQASGFLEVIAIDSSSQDDSVELLRTHGAQVEVIPHAHFRHGATRNRIASKARGEFLVFLSQDALPVG